MRVVLTMCLLFVLSGCAMSGGLMGLSPAQLREAVKVKDQDVSCFTIVSAIYGNMNMVFASADRGIYGTVTVDEKCKVTIVGDSKAKALSEPQSMKATTDERPRLAEPAERTAP